MSLTKGQVVIVYATELDGWCYGRVPDRQQEGWFPASHWALQTVHDRPGDKTQCDSVTSEFKLDPPVYCSLVMSSVSSYDNIPLCLDTPDLQQWAGDYEHKKRLRLHDFGDFCFTRWRLDI